VYLPGGELAAPAGSAQRKTTGESPSGRTVPARAFLVCAGNPVRRRTSEDLIDRTPPTSPGGTTALVQGVGDRSRRPGKARAGDVRGKRSRPSRNGAGDPRRRKNEKRRRICAFQRDAQHSRPDATPRHGRFGSRVPMMDDNPKDHRKAGQQARDAAFRPRRAGRQIAVTAPDDDVWRRGEQLNTTPNQVAVASRDAKKGERSGHRQEVRANRHAAR